MEDPKEIAALRAAYDAADPILRDKPSASVIASLLEHGASGQRPQSKQWSRGECTFEEDAIFIVAAIMFARRALLTPTREDQSYD